MRFVVGILIILILSTIAWAGTWKDNFEDGNLDGWRMAKVPWSPFTVLMLDEGNWRIEDGAVMGGDNNELIVYYLFMGEVSWADYTAEVSLKLSKELRNCSAWSGAYLSVRGQKPLIYMHYCLGIQYFGKGGAEPKEIQVEEGKMVAAPVEVAGGLINSSKELAANQHVFPKMLFETKANVWYRLRVTVSGSLVSCFIDQKQVCEFQNSMFATGLVSFAVNGVVAMFDDFMVTGPKVPNGGPGFTVNPKAMLASTWGDIKSCVGDRMRRR